MNSKQYGLMLAIVSAFSLPLYAATLVPVSKNDLNPAAMITYKTMSDQATPSNMFLSSEPITLTFSVDVATKDVGQSGDLFVVARYNNTAYQLTAGNNWQVWDEQVESLQPYQKKVLDKQEQLTILSHQALPAGEYLVYAGYSSSLQPQTVFYNAVPASMAVFAQNSSAMHRVVNTSVLTELFERGGTASTVTTGSDLNFSPAPLSPASSSSSLTAETSQTNLQEKGVDESDRIKVIEDRLFVLESCASDALKQCLAAYRMTETPAATSALGALELGGNSYQATLYATQTSIVSTQKNIVYLGNSMPVSTFTHWFSPYYWQDNATDIKFIDVSTPGAMQVTSTITLNAALLSSRVVDNVLYVVTRKNPHFYTQTPPVPLALGAPAAPLTTALLPDSIQILPPEPPVVPSPPDIVDLLPTITFNNGNAAPLVQAADCYIPARSSEKAVDNTLITITAIPLAAPESYYSVCVAGSVDTFYMSTQALYLASTRYSYPLSGNTFIFEGKQEVTTEIHKFGLADAALTYKGSGEVPGHLGWEADKQPFRMGDYNAVLKVATSQGDTWNETSTTRVSVLQEDTATQTLKETGFLDKLGKPGERLFAARFIKNKGYLVTFKTTDPLYVLDFKEPSKPEIVGELMINGYSDYLHPIGDDYLLGIGKDALANEDSTGTIFADVNRGAWYQGVKLSLFDVSSKENLRTVDSVVIGKRGTESGVLYDHHALAWLAASSTKGTLSIPIELHNNQLPSTQLPSVDKDYYTQPYANYDWTHTGLYTFSIDTEATPAITLKRRLLANVNSPSVYDPFSSGMSTYYDRAIIQGNSVHYVHNNRVLSSSITEP